MVNPVWSQAQAQVSEKSLPGSFTPPERLREMTTVLLPVRRAALDSSAAGLSGLASVAPAVGLGPVDLGHDGRQHGRPRRHLNDFDIGVEAFADFYQLRSQPHRDGVALF